MADIGSGPAPQIVIDYGKNFVCPWCKAPLEHGDFLRLSREYSVPFKCPKNRIFVPRHGHEHLPHFELTVAWNSNNRKNPEPLSTNDIELDCKSFRFMKNNSYYEIVFSLPLDHTNVFFFNDRAQVFCRIVDDKDSFFYTKMEYFESENFDPDYLARKIETIRLLK